jgi:hypothetical protein
MAFTEREINNGPWTNELARENEAEETNKRKSRNGISQTKGNEKGTNEN